MIIGRAVTGLNYANDRRSWQPGVTNDLPQEANRG